ncbi:MAG TPA: hypothetical protein VFL60_04000 [Gaiellaceae bacterium]|nr:hypothetical protein [Gaiellaceae bacterium]
MAVKPLDQWTPDELRLEIARLAEELARRAAAPAPGRKSAPDVVRSCENWVRGHAWDDSFTLEMVEDELAVHERKLDVALQPLERDRLLQLWQALYAERYAAAA